MDLKKNIENTEVDRISRAEEMSSPTDDSDCALSVIEARNKALCQFLLDNDNRSEDSSVIQSFDWEIKFLTGSSSLSSLKQQKATLILNGQRDDAAETISLEMDISTVSKIITQLDNIRNCL